MIYLASPYTDPDPEVMTFRHDCVERYIIVSLAHNLFIFSPVVYFHRMALKYKLPDEQAFWLNICFRIFNDAEALWVLQLNGWDKSTGVTAEIEFAEDRSIPIKYISWQE